MSKDLSTKEIIIFDLDAKTKEEVIRSIAEKMNDDGRLLDKEGYINDVIERESQSSTAIGFSVATPHAKSTSVKEDSLGFARLKNPIIWDNNEEVKVVFQIAVSSPGKENRHLEILSKLCRQFIYEDFLEKLLNINTEQELLDILNGF